MPILKIFRQTFFSRASCYKQSLKCLILLISLTTLMACGFQPRSGRALPPQLKLLYLKQNPGHPRLNQSIQQLFQALGIRLVDQPQKAPYIFEITQASFEHDQPSITTSNQAITYTYTLKFHYQITDSAGHILWGPQRITASRQVIMNANQIYTNNLSPFIKGQLEHEVTTLLFNQLISQQMKTALNHKR